MKEQYTVQQALADYRAMTGGKMPETLAALDDRAFNEAAGLLCELAALAAGPQTPAVQREMEGRAGELEKLLRHR